MFKIGHKVEIRPVLTTSDFIAFKATVVSNANVYTEKWTGDEGETEHGWYVVEDDDGNQFDALATVTFSDQEA